MTFPRRMTCEGWPTSAVHTCITQEGIHWSRTTNGFHTQQIPLCNQKLGSCHNYDRTSRKYCTEKCIHNNHTACPLFHNGLCVSLAVSLLLLCNVGHRSHQAQKTTGQPVTEGTEIPATLEA